MMMILHRVCTEFNDLVRWELSFFGNCSFPMFIIPCWLMSLLMTVLDLSILASDCFFKSHEAKRCSRFIFIIVIILIIIIILDINSSITISDPFV